MSTGLIGTSASLIGTSSFLVGTQPSGEASGGPVVAVSPDVIVQMLADAGVIRAFADDVRVIVPFDEEEVEPA